MKKINFDDLNKIKFVSNFMISVSILTQKPIDSIFNIDDLDTIICSYDCFLNYGIEESIENWIYKHENSKIEIQESFLDKVEQLVDIFLISIKNIIINIGYINYEQFMLAIEKYN